MTDLGMVVEQLLPTPRAQLGEDRNNKPWLRPLHEPQNLKNAVGRMPASAPTPAPSTARNAGTDPHLTPPPTDD